MAAAAPPLFGTVLVARTPQESPSPLELQIRNSSARLRVVQKLSGGAHLLLPGAETTIAIRIYFSKDIKELTDDDGLVDFRNAFKYPVCFFVLSSGPEQQEQLADVGSFVSRAQLIMKDSNGARSQQTDGSARVFIVPDVASAIKILSSIVQSLMPARRDLKKQFHDAVKSKNFVGANASQDAASTHVTAAFRDFAYRFELPVGEDDVLMSRYGSISAIGTADLSSAPIYDTTKDTLMAFFGSRQQPVGGFSQSNDDQQTNHLPLEMQDPYPVMLSYQAANAAPMRPPFASSEYRTPPRHSMADTPTTAEDERMDYSPFDAWQKQPQNVSATPQLVSQQFVPRHQRHMLQMYNKGSPPNDDSVRLQFNARAPMGNPIRPFSAGSRGGDIVPGYFG